MVEVVVCAFVFVLIFIFLVAWEERANLRKEICNDFHHMDYLFQLGWIIDGVESIRKTYGCKELKEEIVWHTHLPDIYGMEEVLNLLRSGHRTKAQKVLSALEAEWNDRGFRIYYPRRLNEYL